MKFLLLLSPIWVLCISLFSPPNHARVLPFFPPISAPALAPESLPISPAPATITAAPLANQFPCICSGTQQRKEDQHRRLVKALSLAIIAVSTVAGLIVLATFCVFVCVWKNSQKSKLRSIQSSDAPTGLALSANFKTKSKKGSVSMLEYMGIEAATDGFSETNILGEGGFGRVYKACFDGRFLAAVKRLEGRDFEKEFQNEVDLMNQIQHPNIVSLLGNCIHGQTRLLVYEFMPNGSLETQLHEQSHGSALSWHMRMKIALDVARGLEYLHEHCNPPVIHRDLKSSNILLDSSFNAKISDFGLAITRDKNRGNIKLSGTLGYVAPEYLLDGKLTEKSDVYAFGIILLELLTGRRPVEKMTTSHCQSITTWAMPQLNDRSKLPNIVDPTIRNTMNLKHLHQVAAVAVLCVQQEPSYRPLITDVLHSLIPLVPVELGGALKAMEYPPQTVPNSAE